MCRLWLGLKLSEKGKCNVANCKTVMSPKGSHGLACRAGGDMVTRHNRLRDLVYQIAKGGALAPVKEKYGLLVDAPGDRPADVFIPSLKNLNNVCIDIAVTCPIKGTYKLDPEACDRYAEEVKKKRYEELFKGVNMTYIPVVFDTYGGVNTEGKNILNSLFEEYRSRQEGSQ